MAATIQDVVYKDLQKKIGINWKRLRHEHGYTIQALADQGISASTQINIEKGRTRTTSLSWCELIAKLYGMTMEEVISELTSPISESVVHEIEKNSGKNYSDLDFFDLYPYNLVHILNPKYKIATIDPAQAERLIAGLLEREQKIIILRFRDQLTYEEIGKKFGVTKERIRQIEAKALRKLRKMIPSAVLIAKAEYDEEKKKVQKLKIENRNLRIACTKAGVKKDIGPDEEEDILMIPIENLKLSVRTFNCLKRAGINTLLDLSLKSLDELKDIRNLGKRSMDEIVRKLEQYSICLT